MNDLGRLDCKCERVVWSIRNLNGQFGHFAIFNWKGYFGPSGAISMQSNFKEGHFCEIFTKWTFLVFHLQGRPFLQSPLPILL